MIAKIVQNEKIDVVFVGKQAIDDDSNQTAQILASLLDWPQALFASKVEPEGDTFKVTRWDFYQTFVCKTKNFSNYYL